MDWILVTQIILGVFTFYFLCCVYGIAEEHITRSKAEKQERKYWQRRTEEAKRR